VERRTDKDRLDDRGGRWHVATTPAPTFLRPWWMPPSKAGRYAGSAI